MPTRGRRLVVLIAIIAFAGGGLRAALALAPAQPTAVTPSARIIFRRHREALGRLPTLVARWSGSITENGQVAQYDITATRDGSFRRTYKFAMAQRSEGSNLTLDWEQDENGNVQTLPAQRHSSMDARLVRLNDLRVEPRDAAVLGVSDIDGRRAYKVSATLQGVSAILYFDEATALLDGADIGPNAVRYRAYRRFEGVAVPTDIVESGPDLNFTLTVDRVDFVLATRGQFDPPAQKRPQFPSGVHEVEVNFDSPRGLILCPVQVNGKLIKFLIDSGSTTSIIDADVAKRLNLPTGGIAKVQGAGLLTGTVAKIDSLNLGGVVFAPLFVQAVPLRLPGLISHEGIDGVLGFDVLAPLVARIAFSRDRIRFIDASSFTYAGRGSVIAIDIDKRVPLISASIGKDDRGTFTVDTGSSATLVMYRHFADKARLDFVDPYEFDQDLASGAGGDFPTRIFQITRLNLGDYSLANVNVEVIMREEGAFASSSSDGIVGSGALAAFSAVFFDYGNKRIILEK